MPPPQPTSARGPCAAATRGPVGRYDICVLNLGEAGLTDDRLAHALSNMPARAFALLEVRGLRRGGEGGQGRRKDHRYVALSR